MEKGKEKKGKKRVKNKIPSTRYKFYKVVGDKIEKTKRECPKCGAGIFLSEHKDRDYCGKCHYLEVKSQ